MAKKIVRGITDVKTITKQGFDTNNVNDLLSDGEHSYIHRKKKDGTEEYHNLTNNVKTIKSTNTDLLTVTNNNNSNNTVTLTPHLETSDGILLSGGTLKLDIRDGINEDLNNLKTTCWVKPADESANLPTGVVGNGILEVRRISDVVLQTYTPFNNSTSFTRTANNVDKSNEKWYPWREVGGAAPSAIATIPETDIEE